METRACWLKDTLSALAYGKHVLLILRRVGAQRAPAFSRVCAEDDSGKGQMLEQAGQCVLIAVALGNFRAVCNYPGSRMGVWSEAPPPAFGLLECLECW